MYTAAITATGIYAFELGNVARIVEWHAGDLQHTSLLVAEVDIFVLLDRHQVKIIPDLQVRLGLNRDNRRIGRWLVIDNCVVQGLVSLPVIIADQLFEIVLAVEHHDPLNILRILERNRQRLVPDDSLVAFHPAGNLPKAVISHLEPVVALFVNVEHAERNDYRGVSCFVRLLVEPRLGHAQYPLVEGLLAFHQQRFVSRMQQTGERNQ